MRARAPTALLVSCLFPLMVSSCAESPTEPAGTAPGLSAPAFAKGGGRGGGGSADVAVAVHTFIGSVSSDDGGPIITDDALHVDSKITDDGRLWVDTFTGNPKRHEVKRRICVDLSHLVDVGSQADLDAFTHVVGSLSEPVCSAVTMHTRTHSNEGLMPGQTEGSIEHAGGKIVLTEFATGKDTWEWRVVWDTSLQAPDPGEVGKGVCIERDGPEHWIVSNGCTADDGTEVDTVVELWRGTETMVARFDVPFRFEVTAT
jgi:hypothetical protein